jgi:hypothetical protein
MAGRLADVVIDVKNKALQVGPKRWQTCKFVK